LYKRSSVLIVLAVNAPDRSMCHVQELGEDAIDRLHHKGLMMKEPEEGHVQ
jgi:hypothetical protein